MRGRKVGHGGGGGGLAIRRQHTHRHAQYADRQTHTHAHLQKANKGEEDTHTYLEAHELEARYHLQPDSRRCVKRDPHMRQKRFIYATKENYSALRGTQSSCSPCASSRRGRSAGAHTCRCALRAVAHVVTPSRGSRGFPRT